MKTIEFGRWGFEYDDERTRVACAKFSDPCSCNGCTNLFTIFKKSNPFPERVKEFFTEVGIDYMALVEAVPHYFDKKRQQYFYSGWYHFVGKIIEGKDGKIVTSSHNGVPDAWHYDYQKVTADFSISFHKDSSLAYLFEDADLDNLVQVQFTLWTDWVVGEVDEWDIV